MIVASRTRDGQAEESASHGIDGVVELIRLSLCLVGVFIILCPETQETKSGKLAETIFRFLSPLDHLPIGI